MKQRQTNQLKEIILTIINTFINLGVVVIPASLLIVYDATFPDILINLPWIWKILIISGLFGAMMELSKHNWGFKI